VTRPRRDLLPLLFLRSRGLCWARAGPLRRAVDLAVRQPAFLTGRPDARPPPRPTTAGEPGEAIPLDTPDPRYTEYFAELKRRIEAKWSCPSEASRKGQSGGGEVRFVLPKDGSVRTVEIVRSSGVRVLDLYSQNAIRMAQPFPPIPASVADDVLPIGINFTYVLGGAQ
jgi:protein TonB